MTSSRIAIAAALGMTLGGFAMSATPAKAADLGGDCCADLEERVAELEATTVRKGNKKVSVTLSGWVVKLGSWWDDGHETNFYVGDKDTTLSSHFQLSGSATIAPGWSAGYTIAVETPGTSASVGFCENQFNDNCALFGDVNTLLSYMWVKSDKYGTINWGQLSQATDNVALLPDLSGTIIEANAVVFDGAGMGIRPKGAKNSQDLLTDFSWGAVLTCNSAGGGLGADCNGYPQNAFRYDTPTWGGFSASTSYGEDDMWDIAVKYAADWNSVKVSAAAGYTLLTDEGCSSFGSPNGGRTCSNVAVVGGGGTPNQNYRQDAELFQVGASVLHVPSGLFAYGLYQNDREEGTQFKTFTFNPQRFATPFGQKAIFDYNTRVHSNAVNENDVWYVKAGIKRTFTPAGATVLFGEWGQYNDMFRGLCGGGSTPPDFGGFGGAGPSGADQSGTYCLTSLTTGVVPNGPAKGNGVQSFGLVTGSEVTRYGIGVVQEIDSAAMHLFARWQHLDLDLDATNVNFAPCIGDPTGQFNCNKKFGKSLSTSWEGLDIFQLGGVIFF